MAYSAILDANIQVGDPITQSLMQKIKDNFDYLYGVAPTGGSAGNGGVQNPSFDIDSDSDGDPDNWTVADYAAGTHALDDTNALHGAYALKFVHPSGAGNGGGYADSSFMECSNLRPFAVNFLHKCSQSGVKVQVVIRYFDEAGVDLSLDETIYSATTNPTSSTSITTDTANPPATAQYCKIRLIGGYTDTDPGSSTNIWFDGVTVDYGDQFVAASGGYVANTPIMGLSGNITSTTYTKVLEFTCYSKGTLHSTFSLTNTSVGAEIAYARVYINGSAVGTEHSEGPGGSSTKTDASITVERGDLVQLYAKSSLSSDTTGATVGGWQLKSSTLVSPLTLNSYYSEDISTP